MIILDKSTSVKRSVDFETNPREIALNVVVYDFIMLVTVNNIFQSYTCI